MSISQLLADNLNKLMELNGYSSSKKLSVVSGVGHGSIQRLRKAQSGATVTTLEKLAKVFKIEPWRLLTPNIEVGQNASSYTYSKSISNVSRLALAIELMDATCAKHKISIPCTAKAKLIFYLCDESRELPSVKELLRLVELIK